MLRTPKQIMLDLDKEIRDELVKLGKQASCTICNSTGRMSTEYTNGKGITRIITMDCIDCKGQGSFDLSNPKAQEQWIWSQKERRLWCKCSEDSETGAHPKSYFVDDGACAGCVRKHHYHCKKCNMITQIG